MFKAFLNKEAAMPLLRRLAFPVLTGLPLAFFLARMFKGMEARALMLFLIIAVFFLLAIILRRFERWLFGLVFLLVPINVDINFEIGPTLYEMRLPMGTTLLNLSMIDIVVTLLYPMWLMRLIGNRSEKVIWPSGATAFLMFTAWGALSILNAENKFLSFVEVVCFLKMFFIFFYMANNLKTKEDIFFAVRCLLAGLFFQTVICFAQQIKQGNIGLGILGERKIEKIMKMGGGASEVFRVGGTVGHPTFLGGYLATMLPISIAVLLQPSKGTKRILKTVIFVMAFFSLIFSYCRSAWIVFAAAGPLMVLRWYRDHLRTHRFNPALIFMLFMAGACLAAPFAPKIYARLAEDDKGSSDSRLPQWKMGLEMVKAHPILGVGLNNYNVVSELYEPYVEDESTRTRVFYFGSKIHNVYLGFAAQTGIPGMIFYLFFLFRLLRGGWVKMKKTEDPYLRSLFAAMILGLLSLFIHEAYHTGTLSNNMSLWIVGACLAAPLVQRVAYDKK